MKCAIVRVLEPEVTIVDGAPKRCEKDGKIPCSNCGRLFCSEHSPQPCEKCHKAFCAQCRFDHLNDNAAHTETAFPN
jgi:hypothetical protein